MGIVEEDSLSLSEVKNLSSRIRLKILKTLSDRRATVSELSRSLNIPKSTVYYHLLRLSEIGFVNRVEDEQRKWIYYELSRKGEETVKKRKITILLLLSSSVLSLAAGILQVERYIASVRKLPVKGVPNETILYSGVVLIFVSALLFSIAYFIWAKDRSL